VGNGLGVGSDTIVQLAGEIDMFGSERGENVVDELEAFVRRPVLN
jgi:hypothetical protein